MAKIVPQVGDVVFWVDPDDHSTYEPKPPYVVVSISSPKPKNVFMKGLNGETIYYGKMTKRPHSGVGLRELRVDPFLTAARKANLKESDGSKSNR